MMPIDFLAEADQEMIAAARYYHSLSSGLGVDYLDAVERAVNSIATSPQTWPVLEGDFRRRLVKRFPFGVICRIEPDKILTVAVAHLRKNQDIGKIESEGSKCPGIKPARPCIKAIPRQ